MLAIRYCSLSAKLLIYLISPRDTLVIAPLAHHLGIARTVRGKRGGLCRRTTSILYSQIVWSNYSARGGAVICTRLKMSYAICDDDSFYESVDRSFEIYFD